MKCRRRKRSSLQALAAASLLTLLPGCGGDELDADADSTGREPLTASLAPLGFSPNPGGLKAYTYVPATLPAGPVPLIVVLHGCTQSAAQLAQSNEWQRVADALGFILVYPEQSSGNNPVSCFNWAGEYGDPANMIRGQGENASIAAMVNKVEADQKGKVDPARRYVVGFSAGGFMATVMLATWPDLFAGGAVMEGGPYHCADDVNPAMSCMSNGKINNGGTVVDGTPQQWAELVKKHAGFASYWSSPPRVPRLMVWHGAADFTVNPANQKSLLKQWTALHGLAPTPTAKTTLKSYPVEQWQKNGQSVIESVTVAKLQHNVAIDPGTAKDQGGSLGSFTQSVGVFAPYHTARFLLDATVPTPVTAPDPLSVNIKGPSSGATVSGVVEVTVEASADVGVSKVALHVEGALVGTRTAPPYVFSWDSSGLQAGVAHGLNGTSVRLARLSAVAEDAAGHQAKDDDTIVIVKPGGGGDTKPPTVAITAPATKLNNVGTLLKKNPVAISGTAADDGQLVKVELALSSYPYLACMGTATPLKTVVASGTSSWSSSLDVSALPSYRCYRVEARAFDGAGHASSPAEIFLSVMNSTAP